MLKVIYNLADQHLLFLWHLTIALLSHHDFNNFRLSATKLFIFPCNWMSKLWQRNQTKQLKDRDSQFPP